MDMVGSSQTKAGQAQNLLSEENISTGKINPALLAACIHCGMCLPACPTYLATGRETESPRGRIQLLTLWEQGQVPLEGRVSEHLNSCLGCLECQTACPSGVKYGDMLDQVRPALSSTRTTQERHLKRYVFAHLLPDYPRLKQLGQLLRFFQRTGGQRLLNRIPGLPELMGQLGQWQQLLPDIPKHRMLPRKSWLSGPKKGQVNLFTGCIMDIFYNPVNHACLSLLAAQQQVVSVPPQTCCGALAMHDGEIDIAKELAQQNLLFFENNTDPIVVTSAGCGAMLKHYNQLFTDLNWKQKAQKFSERIMDITEFLSSHEFGSSAKSLSGKVAYHAACHLYHAQNIHSAPEQLLSRLPGIEIIPLVEAEHCCGSAGIFNLTHHDLSEKILQRKMKLVAESGADILVTTNPGCLLQLAAGARQAHLPIKVCHLAELLAEAYCPSEK